MSMITMNNSIYRFLTCILLLFFGIQSFAETENETISKCLTDLKSKDVDKRRRAVLILCKYQSSEVYQSLIPSLSDPDSKVRESVVIGFIESRMMMRNAAMPILRRLLDTNVHTRRMVSSTLLPRITFYLHGHREESTKILRKAIKDKDAIVRKNLINNYYTLRRNLSTADFSHLLADPSSEIRFLALTKLSQVLAFEDLTPYLDKLIVDKDKKIRAQILKSLGGFGVSGRKYLTLMAKDEDTGIAARAMAYTRNEQYLDAIFQIILSSASPSDLIVDLTQIIINWNEKSQQFVYKLLEHADETRRFAALSAINRMRKTIPQKTLLKLVGDDSSRVRKLSTSLLTQTKVSAKIVSSLALSDYKDVRAQALRLAVRNSADNSSMIEALYDLMLDEEITIRVKALQAIWMCNAPDKYDIYSQSLTDSEPMIRDMAARMLLGSDEPEAKKLIEDFKKKNKDVDIKHLQDLNIVTDLKSIADKQEPGWRDKIKKALYHNNMSVKKAAVDVMLLKRDPLLFDILKEYLDTQADQKLADYLFKKIAEEEN